MVEGTKRTVGRPRAQNTGPAGPASDAILLAAAELFAGQGYAATSTREIADRVGIRQPSLFHHYSKKEDILRAIVDKAAATLLDQLPGLEKRRDRAAVKLYELMNLDFQYLMTEPYGIGKLLLLPELRSGALGEDVEQKRDRIIGVYRKFIRQGVREGDFSCGDINVATYTVFGMGEAIWTWYQPSRSKPVPKVAAEIADMAMRALLVDTSELQSIKDAAQT